MDEADVICLTDPPRHRDQGTSRRFSSNYLGHVRLHSCPPSTATDTQVEVGGMAPLTKKNRYRKQCIAIESFDQLCRALTYGREYTITVYGQLLLLDFKDKNRRTQ